MRVHEAFRVTSRGTFVRGDIEEGTVAPGDLLVLEGGGRCIPVACGAVEMLYRGGDTSGTVAVLLDGLAEGWEVEHGSILRAR
jgi:translation elongation factor EF-Tu-like GTPase